MTVKAASFRAAFGAILGVLVSGGPAAAHPEFSPVGSNRYVTAAVFDGRVDVTDAVLEGALVSGEERRRLDTDGDGTVSEVERRAGEDRLRAAGPALGIQLDGQPLAGPMEVGIDLGGDARVGAAALVVEVRQSFASAWSPGDHQLRVALARDPARIIETEIGVVLGPGIGLRGGTERVRIQGARTSALQDRAALFTFAPLSPPPSRHSPTPVLVLVLVLVAVLVAVAVLVRSRRRPRSP